MLTAPTYKRMLHPFVGKGCLQFRQHLLWVRFPTVTDRERDGHVPINDRCAFGWKGCHKQTDGEAGEKLPPGVFMETKGRINKINRISHNCPFRPTIFFFKEEPPLPAQTKKKQPL